MDETTIRNTLRQYIASELIRDANYPLADDETIISDGLMDSLALADLGVYIEETFNVYIPDPELTVEKMDTLDLMVARVMRGLA